VPINLPLNAGANRGATTPVQPAIPTRTPVCVTPCPIAVRGLGRGTLLAGTIGGSPVSQLRETKETHQAGQNRPKAPQDKTGRPKTTTTPIFGAGVRT
jgi:hypothetical protein